MSEIKLDSKNEADVAFSVQCQKIQQGLDQSRQFVAGFETLDEQILELLQANLAHLKNYEKELESLKGRYSARLAHVCESFKMSPQSGAILKTSSASDSVPGRPDPVVDEMTSSAHPRSDKAS
ncbi:hypothetical protein TCAL_04759 [Tigriopus californicus]|uniref:Uncharacterized protein n=1 Tax=Tigriopus californicus TaxID=6832 RepID=A0A553P1Z9_TIGCA|nr:uncharacterized protein LOC131883008 [Tigriopus californicus]TRY71709.1 hypothetical protein TCAL_04759 [Tigriopus californicus]|eukprot:TCALIF_04759-PA protein Name:"Protein of unknown function" AED:0.00 eAED:0.00 QI:58/1/1/1/1/1/2/57/122